MSQPGKLPNSDEFFGGGQGPGLPSADQFFAPPQPSGFARASRVAADLATASPNTSADMDDFIKNTSVGHVLGAFGQGFAQQWGADAGKLPDEAEQWLTNAGVFNDYSKGRTSLIKSFNEAIIRPVAGSIDIANRSIGGAFGGAEQAAYQAGVETGQPQLGRTAAEMLEYAGQRGDIQLHPLSKGAGPIDLAAQNLAKSRSLAVVGEGEGGFFGTKEPTPTSSADRAEAVKADAQHSAEQAKEAGQPAPEPANQPPPDIHTLAREAAPEVFAKYDPLSLDRDRLRSQLSTMADQRRQLPEAVGAQSHIDTILGKVHGVEDRLTNAAAERLDAARDSLDEILRHDTPEMSALRKQIQTTDYQMRDLAPQVSAAYREAQAKIPVQQEPEPALPEQAPQLEAAESPVSRPRIVPAAAIDAPPIEVPNVTGKPIGAGTPIASDIAQRLVAVGRPQEEADAAGALVQEHYETRSARFKGALGTAQELYAKEGPSIRRGRKAASAELELAQEHPEKLSDDALIRLMGEEDEKYATEPGAVDAQGKPLPQTIIPGAEQTMRQKLAAEFAKREARGKIEPKKAQKGPDIGLFAKPEETPPESGSQGSLFQGRRGSIAFKDGQATIRLMKDADASTFIHETGHQWLEELLRDAADERAPADLKADAQTVHKWLGTEEGKKIPTQAHEKWARGFERYMMEGVAPSQSLARIFAKFKTWLTQIYHTVARLRAPITEDIRGVFDRLLAEKPERTVIAPERPIESHMADIHEAEAEQTEPERATPVADQVRGEIDSTTEEKAPHVRPALRSAEEAGRIAGENASVSGRADEARPAARTEGNARQSGAQPAGRNEAQGQGRTVRGILEPVPREPPSLTTFLLRRGGLRDHGGEVKAIAGGTKGRRALIRNNGLPLDRAGEAAWQAGYFRERPDTQEFLDALDNDLRGQKLYSDLDHDDVIAWRGAVSRNAELDRLATEFGIDIKNTTRGEFFNKLSEHMSVKEMEDRAREQGEHFESLFEEAKREAEEFLASRGEAWEADVVPEGPLRSLEDLERERDEEEAAYRNRGSAGGAGPSGPAAEHSGEVQTGGGSRGPGARTSGGSAKTEPPSGPNAGFRTPESDLVDKLGNIRLDNLNTTRDVDQFLHAGEENDGFASAPNPVSDAQALEAADAMGLRPQDLNVAELSKFSRGFVFAVRKLFVDASTAAHDAALQAARGGDADVLAYAEARSRLRMVQEYLTTLTYTGGSMLRGFRELPGAQEAKTVASLMGDLSQTRTLYQLRQEAARLAKLDDPRKAASYLRQMDKPGLGEMALELFINNWISGPITHSTYVIGNTLLALWKAVPETATEAALGATRAAFGSDAERAYFGEVGAQLYAMFGRGARDGFRAMVDAAKAGQTMPLPGEMSRGTADMFSTDTDVQTPFTGTKAIPNFRVAGVPVPLGSFIRAPGERLVAPIHSFYRTVGYTQSIARQAYRAAKEEGLRSEAFNARIADLTANPTDAMMKIARGESTDQTLMGQGGPFMRAVSNILNYPVPLPWPIGTTRIGRFVAPFTQIFGAMERETILKRSPLAYLSPSIRDDLLGRNGSLAQNRAHARVAVGVGLSAVGMGLAAEGVINPSAPADPRERAQWTLVHGMPHSVRIGDLSFDISRLGVLGMHLGIAADLYHATQTAVHGDIPKAGSLLVHSVAQNFLDEGFASGISQMLQAVEDSDRYGRQWVENFVKSAVPYAVGLSQVARQIDPYAREARDLMDKFRAEIPFESEHLEPRRDVWGEPILNRDWAGVYYERVTNDPVNQELLSLGIFPGRPLQKIRGVAISDQQYDDMSRIGGRYAKALLDNDIKAPGWSSIPAEQRIEIVKKDIETARESARTAVMMNDYATAPRGQSIIDRATELKTAPLRAAETVH